MQVRGLLKMSTAMHKIILCHNYGRQFIDKGRKNTHVHITESFLPDGKDVIFISGV
jgi:hypothetical protein